MMMNNHAYAAWITQTELQTALASNAAGFNWMILEAVNELIFKEFKNEFDAGRYETGRVFGSHSELRWKRDGPKYHVLQIGDSSQPSAFSAQYHQEIDSEIFDSMDREYFLWGEWTKETPIWVEAIIPHIFDYPQPPPQTGRWRRKIKAVEYINRLSGETQFYRFTEIFEVRI
jgi:hypothetical protein